jgi:hypothetical protein
LILNGFSENKIRKKRKNVALFVSDSNYLMAIMGPVDPKWLLLEKLHDWEKLRKSRGRYPRLPRISPITVPV